MTAKAAVVQCSLQVVKGEMGVCGLVDHISLVLYRPGERSAGKHACLHCLLIQQTLLHIVSLFSFVYL